MGPIELADVVGLDVAADVGEIIAAELGRPAPDLTRLQRAGRREEARPQERRRVLRLEGRQGRKPRRPERAPPARSDRPADPGARERVRRLSARGRRRGCRPRRCGGHFRHRLRAVPRRPAGLCAQPRRRRGRRRGWRSSPRATAPVSSRTPAGRWSRRLRQRDAEKRERRSGATKVLCYHRN